MSAVLAAAHATPFAPLGHGHAHGPHIDFAGLSPLIALLGGAIVVLLVGLARARWARARLVPALTLVSLGAAIGLTIWQLHEQKSIIAGALRVDDLSMVLALIFEVTAVGATLLAWRGAAPEEAGHGEFNALLLSAVGGMVVLAMAQNTISMFLGYELLSISLYVACASELRRAKSLESGLKYLIIGSVGAATLVYGLALIYGATGSTQFSGIARAIDGGVAKNALLLTGIGLTLVGLAFKASVAPFHQWTPDVYEGAPTPITAFMAIATKAAAFAVILRFLDVALLGSQLTWAPMVAALAAITIVVGNVGALSQDSLKRMLGYSGVAQAGYLLAGVVVASRLGVRATVFYLAVYTFMNLAAFAVVVARERETDLGDDISALAGLGASRPLLAWPMTIAMLSLAGIPATAGFVGKLFLIQASVDGSYTWLGIMIVIGSMISLGYYLRVVATMWMRPAVEAPGGRRPAMAGGSPEADALGGPEADGAPAAAAARAHPEVIFVAVLFGAASLFFGIVPGPLFDLAHDAGAALTGLF